MLISGDDRKNESSLALSRHTIKPSPYSSSRKEKKKTSSSNPPDAHSAHMGNINETLTTKQNMASMGSI